MGRPLRRGDSTRTDVRARLTHRRSLSPRKSCRKRMKSFGTPRAGPIPSTHQPMSVVRWSRKRAPNPPHPGHSSQGPLASERYLSRPVMTMIWLPPFPYETGKVSSEATPWGRSMNMGARSRPKLHSAHIRAPDVDGSLQGTEDRGRKRGRIAVIQRPNTGLAPSSTYPRPPQATGEVPDGPAVR